MKSAKVLGLLVCALACAMSDSVVANTTNGWFGVTVGEGVDCANCATNGAAITISESMIVLDNDLDSALRVIPDASFVSTNVSDGLVSITSSAVLTPSDFSDLEPVVGAQAGFSVAVDNNETNFYGYASAGGDGNAPAWIKLTNGTLANPEAPTTFTIALNYRDFKVSFYQGDTLLTDGTSTEFNISNDFTRLNNVAAYGSGAISSVTSQYEVAVAAVVDGASTNLYGSASEAVVATRNGGSVKDITADGKATEDKQASNGLYAWECDVLNIATDGSIALTPADKAVTGKITLKLAEANQPADGVTVTFGVNDGTETTGSYASDCIEIPMTTGTYTVVPTITATPAP